MDGIRGLEQREVAEIRVERCGTQSVCEYGVFDIKTESVGYQNITFLAVAGCLHPHAERTFPQCRKARFASQHSSLRSHIQSIRLTVRHLRKPRKTHVFASIFPFVDFKGTLADLP